MIRTLLLICIGIIALASAALCLGGGRGETYGGSNGAPGNSEEPHELDQFILLRRRRDDEYNKINGHARLDLHSGNKITESYDKGNQQRHAGHVAKEASKMNYDTASALKINLDGTSNNVGNGIHEAQKSSKNNQDKGKMGVGYVYKGASQMKQDGVSNFGVTAGHVAKEASKMNYDTASALKINLDGTSNNVGNGIHEAQKSSKNNQDKGKMGVGYVYKGASQMKQDGVSNFGVTAGHVAKEASKMNYDTASALKINLDGTSNNVGNGIHEAQKSSKNNQDKGKMGVGYVYKGASQMKQDGVSNFGVTAGHVAKEALNINDDTASAGAFTGDRHEIEQGGTIMGTKDVESTASRASNKEVKPKHVNADKTMKKVAKEGSYAANQALNVQFSAAGKATKATVNHADYEALKKKHNAVPTGSHSDMEGKGAQTNWNLGAEFILKKQKKT